MKCGGLVLIVACLGACVIAAPVVTLDEAMTRTQEDVVAARAELHAQRTKLDGERAEISQRLSVLQREVAALRGEWREMERAEGRSVREHDVARRKAEAVDAEHRQRLQMGVEFRRAIETRMTAAGMQQHRALMEACDEALATDERDGITLDGLGVVLALAREVAWTSLPTRTWEGTIVDESAVVRAGTYVGAGPLSWFASSEASSEKGPVGLALTGPDGLDPRLFSRFEARWQLEWERVIGGDSGLLPVDISLGDLVKMEQSRMEVWAWIRQGGMVMWPLLFLGCAGVLVALTRCVALYRMKEDGDAVARRVGALLRKGELEAARESASRARRPWRDVLEDGIRHHAAERLHLEEVLMDAVHMQGPRLTRHLSLLALCAASAPLLGLLGTVTGMIRTFQLITLFGSGDARMLSGGISEALITTQVGLCIAVPALIAHALLSRVARRRHAELERLAVIFVRTLHDEKGAT